jgi:AcrR family transcriptional regulator
MRAIARAAGVAVSDAYYLPSKEHLTLGLYDDLQAAHREAAAPVLASSTEFATRFAGTLHAGPAHCLPCARAGAARRREHPYGGQWNRPRGGRRDNR